MVVFDDPFMDALNIIHGRIILGIQDWTMILQRILQGLGFRVWGMGANGSLESVHLASRSRLYTVEGPATLIQF